MGRTREFLTAHTEEAHTGTLVAVKKFGDIDSEAEGYTLVLDTGSEVDVLIGDSPKVLPHLTVGATQVSIEPYKYEDSGWNIDNLSFKRITANTDGGRPVETHARIEQVRVK